MTTFTFLIVIWAMTLVAFVGMLIYRSHLTAHETRLHLYEGEETCFHVGHHHAIRRAKVVHPICLGTGSLALVMTLVIGGLWVTQKLSVGSSVQASSTSSAPNATSK
jgi:hypothetical protein